MRIELRGVAKRFAKVEALRGVDVEIPLGRRVALVGPNGSGKSTLIRALLGLIRCEGSIQLDGRRPYEDRIEIAKKLAYVPQVAPALGASVAEVVELVGVTRGLQPGRVAELSSRFELDLKAIAARPFRNLSGGMKQKLLLAIAFAVRPSLLVMDEPTASLDYRARERFFELCGELEPNVTVIFCSHRGDEFVRLSEVVIALEDGRVAYNGPVDAYAAAVAEAAAS